MRATLFLTCSALALMLARPAAGQSAPAVAAAPPATQTLYFDIQGKQISTAEGAEHREEVTYRDSLGGTLRIFYPSGKLRRMVPYAHFAHGVKYGAETSYYESGEIKSRCEYNLNGPVGYHIQFYRNGKVRSRLPLGKNLPKKTKPESFGPDGQPREFKAEVEKMPTLDGGGNAAIVSQVQRAVHYPAEALRAQITGKVMVNFMVDDAGFVRNVQIVKTPSPVFNKDVLAAVASLGRLTPGEQDGDTVDVFYAVPITFRIK
jgi:protein TonB